METDEWIGFDAANFVVMQEKGRYGRDIAFSGVGDEKQFRFTSVKNNYGYAFDKLVDYDKIYGYESEVKGYISIDNGVTYYLVGQILFSKKKTDQISYFDCNFVQDTSNALLQRRFDVNVDLFSETDLDGNPITPIPTVNILLKAKPVVQESEWKSTPFYAYTGNYGSGSHLLFQNPISGIFKNNIENTLSGALTRYMVTYVGDPNFYNKLYDFGFIDSVNDLTDVNINLKGTKISYYIETGASLLDPSLWNGIYQSINLQFVALPIGLPDYTIADIYELRSLTFMNPLSSAPSSFPDYSYEFIGNENIDRFNFPNLSGSADRYDITLPDISRDFPDIPRGYRLCIIFDMGRSFTITEWLAGSYSITGSSTAIDSVTKGIRLIDAMKQVSKSINPAFTINAPRFDVGGEWYDNFVFDGNLIRGRIAPFVMTQKDLSNQYQEFNSDYEIKENIISVLKYPDFYTKTEIGSFLQRPDKKFGVDYNELYMINTFRFNYKNFEQDRDSENTLDAVHTESQWLNANKNVENDKPIELDFIRDPFLLESTRKKAVSESSASLSQDDKVFINDCVTLSPLVRGGFSASLTHFVNSDGRLQLLNDGSFNWALLGFGLGVNFTIINTSNAGNYTVFELDNNIITLTNNNPTIVTPTSIGQNITKVSYPFTNVQFTIRTNEGFTLIENILNPDKFANLLYTPKRNILNNWGSYLKTCTKFKPEVIRNTYFKNGGELITQYQGGPLIQEKANIEQSELTEAILTPRLITTSVICDFETYRAFEQQIRTVRGFVRVVDNDGRVLKGYPKKSDYEWTQNLLTLELEEKFESEFLTLEKDGIYIINEVGYDIDLVPELEYQTENDYIQFFDAITRPLTNKVRYDFVKVNGITYESITELATAINGL